MSEILLFCQTIWNIFREQNSSLSSEDQFDFTNSDADSRNSPHKKNNRCLTDINRCLADISQF